MVKKSQKNVTGIEDQILALYAKGVSTREIQDHLKQLYGIDVSPTLISNISGKIMPMIKEWQNRPLQRAYAIIFLDAIHFKVRDDIALAEGSTPLEEINIQDFDPEAIYYKIKEVSDFWISIQQ